MSGPYLPRKQRGGRKKYSQKEKGLIIRAELLPEESIIQSILTIETNDELNSFLSNIIVKPAVSFNHVSLPMLTKIEQEVGVIIEPAPPGDEEITECEAKRRTLVAFFGSRKWLEVNTQKLRESITIWFSIYKKCVLESNNIEDPDTIIQFNADGTVNVV